MPSPKAECAHCKDENSCGVRVAMKAVRDATAKVLDGTPVEAHALWRGKHKPLQGRSMLRP